MILCKLDLDFYEIFKLQRRGKNGAELSHENVKELEMTNPKN
jgi:hypothetical protein